MVDVLLGLPGGDVVNVEALGGKVLVLELVDLVLQVDDGLAVGRPAGVAPGLGHAGAAAAVEVHEADAAAFCLALAAFRFKADLLAVR